MAKTRYRVGIIGAAPGVSWGARAHVPALRALPDDFEIAGVANSGEASSKAAAEALGIPRAFKSPAELCNAPDVDIVAVTVRVQHHLPLVKAALDAGKHVYCEWPVGNGLEESRQLAQMAKKAGVHAVCGIQGRVAIELGHIRKLVQDGYVGRILSVSLLGKSNVGLARIPPAYAYTADKRNGATVLTITGGHTLSTLQHIFGPFTDVSARLVNRRASATIIGTDTPLPKTSEDQVLIHGLFADGAPVSIHYRAGLGPGTGLLWEIYGEDGVIQIKGSIAHPHNDELTILGARGDEPLHDLSPPQEQFAGWPKEVVIRNVARLYSRLAEDLRNGTHTAPSFDDAVEVSQTVAAVEAAAESGGRVSPRTL